jgi:hypothetical protein
LSGAQSNLLSADFVPGLSSHCKLQSGEFGLIEFDDGAPGGGAKSHRDVLQLNKISSHEKATGIRDLQTLGTIDVEQDVFELIPIRRSQYWKAMQGIDAGPDFPMRQDVSPQQEYVANDSRSGASPQQLERLGIF